VSLTALLHASDLALARALVLHASLVKALRVLEEDQVKQQASRLQALRLLREAQSHYRTITTGTTGSTNRSGDSTSMEEEGDGGLNLNDPILRYDYTHVTSACTVTTK
jgi:hypothetical protein